MLEIIGVFDSYELQNILENDYSYGDASKPNKILVQEILDCTLK